MVSRGWTIDKLAPLISRKGSIILVKNKEYAKVHDFIEEWFQVNKKMRLVEDEFSCEVTNGAELCVGRNCPPVWYYFYARLIKFSEDRLFEKDKIYGLILYESNEPWKDEEWDSSTVKASVYLVKGEEKAKSMLFRHLYKAEKFCQEKGKTRCYFHILTS